MKDPSSQSSTSPKRSNLPWWRRWLAKVWLSYGGGLYAVGYAATFAYLEITTFFGELFEADGIVDFVTGQLFEFIIRFATDSIANMVQAFIWFLPVIEFKPPVGMLVLGVGFYVFDIYLREPVAKWILGDDEGEE